MKIAITGAYGQLGRSLQESLGTHELLLIDIPGHDVTNPGFTDWLAEQSPHVVIHAAAMTDVDGCTRKPGAAYHVNGFGTQNVALACQRCGAAMVYVSTNEVFDGTASSPYHEFAPTNPINAYACSKLAGEKIASMLLERLYVVRTAWLFAPGGTNFVTKIIAAADKKGSLSVVTDEVASPTYAPDLADAIAALISTGHYGIYHFTNEGICSRYKYAIEILRQAGMEHVPVSPITGDRFERASTPPPYAAIENNCGAALGIRLRHWVDALTDYFRQAGSLR